ncbi:MAG: hypothetical protein QM669_00125 [Siphonobacter sp.]
MNIVNEPMLSGMLERLSSIYRASLTQLGSEDETSTEFIFDYRLKIQTIEGVWKTLHAGDEVNPIVYQEIVEDYQTFFP